MSGEPQRLYKEAFRLEQDNRLAEAFVALSRANLLAPHNRQIEMALGKVDSLLGKNDEAIAVFRKVFAANADDPEGAQNLALALAAKGSYDEALIYVTTANRLRPGAADTHYLQGKILVDLGRWADALQQFRVALALSPDHIRTLYAMALLYEANNQPTEEIAVLRHLIHLQENTANYHLLLARALSHGINEEDAEQEFRRTLVLDPESRFALYSLSRLLQKSDPLEADAMSNRFRALKLTDEELNTMRDQGNSGVRAMQRGDWVTAISTFQAALAACSGCDLEATLLKDLGLAQCQGGEPAAGIVSLQRSFLLNPRDVEVLQAIERAKRELASGKP